MSVGIVGLPESGKTTLFRALTRCTVKTDQSGKPNVGVVSVPDRRIDYFVEQYKPKKTTYASIEFIDGAAQIAQSDGRNRFGSDFFSDVRRVDALVHVIRGFANQSGDAPAPVQDMSTLSDELLLADLGLVESRMERVEKQLHGVKKGSTTPATMEMDLLQKLHSALDQGQSLKTLDFDAEEEKALRTYDFLTLKQLIVALNIPESEIGNSDGLASEFLRHCEQESVPAVVLCAEVEMDVSALDEDEEGEFLHSMGIEEPARNVLIRECYKALNLISFITAGEPEVRAWTLRKGLKAIDAAGTIHSDLARGFIRAEILNFEDVEAAGGWEAAKQKGLIPLQGKDYVVRDGDVMYIRFKV